MYSVDRSNSYLPSTVHARITYNRSKRPTRPAPVAAHSRRSTLAAAAPPMSLPGMERLARAYEVADTAAAVAAAAEEKEEEQDEAAAAAAAADTAAAAALLASCVVATREGVALDGQG